MYLPGIKVVMEQAREVIDYAVSGDIEKARSALDRVRILRSRMARTVQSSKLAVAKELQEEMGVHLAKDDLSLPVDITDTEIVTYRLQVAKLTQSLETIQEWLTSSMDSFSLEELLSSEEGINLMLDNMLPEIWDFSQDIAVIAGSEAPDLYPLLAARRQKRIVVMTDDAGMQQLSREHGDWLDNLEIEGDTITLVWNLDDPSHNRKAAALTTEEVPKVTLLGHSMTQDQKDQFLQICKHISFEGLGVRSLKEWPLIFLEQWLNQLPEMTRFKSVSDVAITIGGADVLIASPGPSLSQSLPSLKTLQQEFVILAPLRSLELLLTHGINPDFVVHVDATDFSKIVPEGFSLREISLICFEHTHPSVWGAGFGQVFTVPDPHLIGSPLVKAIHGEGVPILPGGGVSVVAAEMAAAFEAASITLIGQDLSLTKGQYVEGQTDERISNRGIDRAVFTCTGINGDTLSTTEDYLWFINEFEQLAARRGGHLPLINSTVFGAFLEGWDHVRLEQHPKLQRDKIEPLASESCRQNPQFRTDSNHKVKCEAIVTALREESQIAEKVRMYSAELAAECQALAESGDTDVTEIDSLEVHLKELLSAPGSLLHFYTSRQTLALSAAISSVQSLAENLSVSAEYYFQMVSRAQKLATLLRNTADEIENTKLRQT